MNKELVICASPYQKKYYFEETFRDIPTSIQEELTAVVATLADKVKAIISVGFYENGTIYIEQTTENVFDDEIGIALEIKNFENSNKELLRSLRLWFMIYRMKEGTYVKAVVLYQAQGMANEDIVQKISQQFGEEAGTFVEQLLD